MTVPARFLRSFRRPLPWVGATIVGLLAAGPAVAGLLDPTPLILKDGRIASVSVHTLPFATGASALDAGASRDLQSLTVAMATDCFLTAQVIGHVGSDEVEANDTLGAHRLARSRADAVQASLIDGGLPAKSIASVWDWQFMVLESRATLWVFRLTEGEDCEGKALDGASGALLAAAESPGQAAPGTTTTRPAAASTAPATAGSNGSSIRPGAAGSATSALARASAPSAGASSPAAAPARAAASSQAAPRARTTAEAAPSTPSRGGSAETRRATSGGTATRALPTVAPAPAAVQAAPVQKVAKRAEPAAGSDGDVTIVFATNSSYFPAGTRDRLAAVLRDLEAGRRYEVELVASVSGTSSVVGATSPDEAARYNKWLADRRLDRVRDWFEANGEGRELVIRPDYRSDDDSRKVTIRISPATTS